MATVVKIITETKVEKHKVINQILNAEPPAKVEEALDVVYRIVLNNAAGTTEGEKEVVRFIVGAIVMISKTSPLPPNGIYAFLPSDRLVIYSEFETVFKKLTPILMSSVTDVRVYHTSFLDFAENEKRCGSYWTSVSVLNRNVAMGCFEIMESGTWNRKRYPDALSGLRFNICKLESSYLANSKVSDLVERKKKYILAELRYSAVYWAEHSYRFLSDGSRRTMDVTRITSILRNLICTD
jgi:hypothetical protein